MDLKFLRPCVTTYNAPKSRDMIKFDWFVFYYVYLMIYNDEKVQNMKV